jgi:hypothetical protein
MNLLVILCGKQNLPCMIIAWLHGGPGRQNMLGGWFDGKGFVHGQ